MAQQQQSKVDSVALKSSNNNVDALFHDEASKDTGNMRSILAEIGITGTPTQDTQSPRPKYRYTKAQLIALSKTPAARRRPSFLETTFFNKSGVWDPTKWVQTKWNDSSNQHAEEHKGKPDRTVDLDRDSVIGKRRSSDPKERLKEEQDGIILSPQRRSFGTGCHVIQQSGNARRPESPTDLRSSERDGHREPSRRIGSGRFISRERDRDREREFGYRPGDRRERDDYDRDERDSRDGRIARVRPGKERRDRGRKGFRRIEEEEEPEWFSGGPTSQSETIELRGFDDFPDDRSREKNEGKELNRRERRQSWRKRKTPSIEEVSEKVEEDSATESAKIQSRPSSETDYSRNESMLSVVEDSIGPPVSEFDFNDLFKMESIPGIFPITASVSQDNSNGLVGSRFGQFFQQRETSPIQSHSTDTSRRSSFQDELLVPIINQLIDPKLVIPSPTPNPDTYFAPISPAQTTPSNDDAAKNLLELLHGTKDGENEIFAKNNAKNAHIKELAMSGKATSVQELEAGLKNLVLGIQNVPDLDDRGKPPPINGQKDDSLNAFKKLLNQISDGQVTPLTTQGMSLSGSEHCNISQEQDTFQQSGSFVSQTLQNNNAHMMNVLKHAPTEQDILAGLVKGQPLSVSMQRQLQSPHESTGILASLLVSSPQGSRPVQTSASHGANVQHNPLAKVTNVKPLPNNSSYGYENSVDLVSGNHASDKLAAYLGVQSSRMGRQPLQQPGSLQSPAPPTSSIQQQQREILAAILKQQQQQQQQVGQRQQSPVQPPVIKRPVSPPALIPQSAMVNGPISPRVQSPHHTDGLQQSILHQHPRIPSPIVFGQTPPVITHAPSPIHPSQVAQSIAPVANALNPNTLQVHAPHVMTRVPSPQELRAHTQQIMQNALIKKKLEEQKENYRKRQEMQGPRSPNATRFGESASLKAPTGMNQTLSIIPTSVMRKMQAGKDKDAAKGIQQSSQQQQPPQPSGQPQSIGGLADKLAKSKPNILPSSTMGLIQLDEPDKGHSAGITRPLHVQSFVNGQLPVRTPQVSLAPNLGSQVPLQGRRIVKSNQGLGNQGQRIVPANQLIGNQQKQFLSASTNFDVTKQLLMQQQQHQQAVAQRQLNVSPMSSTSALGHPGLPLRGTNLLHAQTLNTVRPGVAMAHNNYLLSNMVHPGQTNAQSHFYQLAALQQRGVDPRQIQVPTSLNPLTVPQLFMGVGNAPRGTMPLATGGHTTLNHHHIHQSTSLMGKSDTLFSLASAGFPSATNTSFSSLKNAGGSSGTSGVTASMGNSSKVMAGRQSPTNNLDKWFGSNLAQKMPNLPPVPTQRAQYVEEVEQRQQATTVQN